MKRHSMFAATTLAGALAIAMPAIAGGPLGAITGGAGGGAMGTLGGTLSSPTSTLDFGARRRARRHEPVPGRDHATSTSPIQRPAIPAVTTPNLGVGAGSALDAAGHVQGEVTRPDLSMDRPPLRKATGAVQSVHDRAQSRVGAASDSRDSTSANAAGEAGGAPRRRPEARERGRLSGARLGRQQRPRKRRPHAARERRRLGERTQKRLLNAAGAAARREASPSPSIPAAAHGIRQGSRGGRSTPPSSAAGACAAARKARLRVVRQRGSAFIEEQPIGLVQERARKREALLLAPGKQFAPSSPRARDHSTSFVEANSCERFAHFIVADPVVRRGIADCVLERAERQVGLLRQEEQLRPLGERDLSFPVGPDAGERAEQRALPGARRAP